jgi:hypothetical protein
LHPIVPFLQAGANRLALLDRVGQFGDDTLKPPSPRLVALTGFEFRY